MRCTSRELSSYFISDQSGSQSSNHRLCETKPFTFLSQITYNLHIHGAHDEEALLPGTNPASAGGHGGGQQLAQLPSQAL